ncbi:S41 family peptidase [Marinobacter sp. ATCH36]|uniref:S41 family peptidase n=1 Tax=Marinobacter sp. ATCH36 TaxID=2945106 RepID=UPI002021AEC5|nr:S41 family peptidase [Marinobacter sp. ATCH36]MCL7943731.1 S41 family peptidase [Marinobacter sp. ATCH36]
MANTGQIAHSSTVTGFDRLQGVWRSRGYGKVLLIDGDEYTIFEETALSCLKLHAGSLDELDHSYENLEVSPNQQAFSARRATGVTRIGFRRLKSLPATAAEARARDKDDPDYNFEVFWHTFAEHYALFALKGVDWHEMYQRFRPRITSGSDPELLYATLAAMLRPLRDGHVHLHTPWGHYSAGALPALYKRLDVELEDAGEHRETTSYLGELRDWLREVIHENYLGGRVRHGANHLVEWGRLNETTGYLNIRAMAGQSGKVGHPANDLAATHVVMQQVLSELGGLPNLAVDIRGNGGGYDGVALCFASYLMDRKRLAFTKSARHGGGFTGQQAVCVTPAPHDTYGGNLFVLTSELTASAAEIFVLALLQHPHLTLIGEPTLGILSDTLERHLPNGWHMTLSNEVYRAFDGETYEDVGIPPHIRLPFLGRVGRESGRDPMLDRVLKLAR